GEIVALVGPFSLPGAGVGLPEAVLWGSLGVLLLGEAPGGGRLAHAGARQLQAPERALPPGPRVRRAPARVRTALRRTATHLAGRDAALPERSGPRRHDGPRGVRGSRPHRRARDAHRELASVSGRTVPDPKAGFRSAGLDRQGARHHPGTPGSRDRRACPPLAPRRRVALPHGQRRRQRCCRRKERPRGPTRGMGGSAGRPDASPDEPQAGARGGSLRDPRAPVVDLGGRAGDRRTARLAAGEAARGRTFPDPRLSARRPLRPVVGLAAALV
ncbi:MAG: hypothetical protein AVDCRST_MAG01-01-2618, partial [uncultured Rubrobacteraceae bacterium]